MEQLNTLIEIGSLGWPMAVLLLLLFVTFGVGFVASGLTPRQASITSLIVVVMYYFSSLMNRGV
jgi:hypothetical protein